MTNEQTNEQKAREIAEHSQILSDFPHHAPSVEYGAMAMAEWKEQQMIEKVIDWLEDHVEYYIDSNEEAENFIRNFKQAMEE